MTVPSNPAAAPDLAGQFRAVSISTALQDKPARKRRKRPAPFSLRLTGNERIELEQAAKAAGLALSAYIKLRLFNNLPELTPLASPNRAGGSGKRPGSDLQLIAKLLSALGSARLSANLNQLAKAANMGTLPVTPETETALRDACTDVKAMRADLVAALGLRGSAGA